MDSDLQCCVNFCCTTKWFNYQTVKNLPANAEDIGLILSSERSPGEGNGYLLQYSWLENSTDKGAWQATIHGVAKSQAWLNDSQLSCLYIYAAAKTSVVSDSVQPHIHQPTGLSRPWDSPGKNTGVGCHFLLQCMKVKSESEVAQSCPTLSDPMDCNLLGSSIHGIFIYIYI